MLRTVTIDGPMFFMSLCEMVLIVSFMPEKQKRKSRLCFQLLLAAAIFITVNIIKNGEIVKKKELILPKEIKNVIHCKNPRCITSIEQGLPHIFVLSDEKKEIYRCKYCEEKFDRRSLL